jgi:CDP-paratose 2-epimerase
MKPVARFPRSNGANGKERRPVVITGGSGFIGANLADRLLSTGQPVVLFDNLSRAGVEQNHRWLRSVHGDLVTLAIGDTRDARAVADAVRDASAVFHLAAQVAVTTSIDAPGIDFAVNAIGTLNVLEALRGLANPPPLVFTSTNKVYGCLAGVDLRQRGQRYEPVNPKIRAGGVDEEQRLDFYSPYGCSKGAADQYVID